MISRIRERVRAIKRVRKAYRQAFGRFPNLVAPQRFSEKMQWRKLFDDNPLYTLLSDKLAVRDFIAMRTGPDNLVPMLWSGEPDVIPFSTVTYPCVLKSTHASGHVIKLLERPTDEDAITVQAREWLNFNHGFCSDEPGYCRVPPRLIIETMVTDDRGEAPEEQRFFVFHGRVAFINTVFLEDGQIRSGAFHTADWTQLSWYMSRKVARHFTRPQQLSMMIEIAERLGRGLDHVRVDFFDCGSRVYVGEMTLYSWSGLSKFDSDETDLLLGAPWRIPWAAPRALAAFGRKGR